MNLAKTHGTPLKVLKKIQETKDSTTFVLEEPADKVGDFKYTAGQYLTLFVEVDGQSLQRSYSLSSAPSCDSHLSISVKRVHGGRVSNWLCDHLIENQTLIASVPMGQFFQPTENSNHLILFAAGSGITPLYSILKEVLATSNKRVSLFFCNRRQDEVIYASDLEKLAALHSRRFSLNHYFSELSGRCTESTVVDYLEAFKPDTLSSSQIYLCGPEGYMRSVELAAEAVGFQKDQMRRESFGIAHNEAKGAKPDSQGLKESTLETTSAFLGSSSFKGDEIVIGDGIESQPKMVRAILNGETLEVAAKPEMSLLESLLDAGFNPPFSCMEGSCMACMAKLKSGKVYQDHAGILTADNLAQLELLACQAKPLTELVELSFDEL